MLVMKKAVYKILVQYKGNEYDVSITSEVNFDDIFFDISIEGDVGEEVFEEISELLFDIDERQFCLDFLNLDEGR